ISNLTIIGQVGFDFLQASTWAKPLVTSWSLSIEICCYLLLAFYFARSPARLWGLIALGVVALALSTAWCAQSADPGAYGARYCFQNRYGVIEAGFIPFGFGGLYYFHREEFGRWFTRRRLFFIVSVVILAFLVNRSRPLMLTLGPFVGIPVMWAILAA